MRTAHRRRGGLRQPRSIWRDAATSHGFARAATPTTAPRLTRHTTLNSAVACFPSDSRVQGSAFSVLVLVLVLVLVPGFWFCSGVLVPVQGFWFRFPFTVQRR